VATAVPVTTKDAFVTVDLTTLVRAWVSGSLANDGIASSPVLLPRPSSSTARKRQGRVTRRCSRLPEGSEQRIQCRESNLIPLVAGDCCEQQSTTLETLSLPSGSYVINAVVMVASGAGTPATYAQCKLRGPNTLRFGHISGRPGGFRVRGATLPVTAQ